MENSLNLLLVLVGVALLLASVALVLAAVCLYRLIQQRPPSFSWTMSSTPSGVTVTPPAVEAPRLFRRRRTKGVDMSDINKELRKKPYVCVHCHQYLPWQPHHGVVHEEKAYVVYVCEKCGKETQLPADHAPSAENPPEQGV